MTTPMIFEYQLVDSLALTGELKFSHPQEPLVWDGTNGGTITAPARPLEAVVSRTMYVDLINRILAWQTAIARTAPRPNTSFSDFKYETERENDRSVLVKMTVAPAPIQDFAFDPIANIITVVGSRPDPIVFPWDNWVKYNALQVRMLSLIEFSML